jgi:hypothetical protein
MAESSEVWVKTKLVGWEANQLDFYTLIAFPRKNLINIDGNCGLIVDISEDGKRFSKSFLKLEDIEEILTRVEVHSCKPEKNSKPVRYILFKCKLSSKELFQPVLKGTVNVLFEKNGNKLKVIKGISVNYI